MNNYTLIFDTYKITIQRAAYIEDGGFIEIIGNYNKIKLI
jgi:ribosomal protein S16